MRNSNVSFKTPVENGNSLHIQYIRPYFHSLFREYIKMNIPSQNDVTIIKIYNRNHNYQVFRNIKHITHQILKI